MKVYFATGGSFLNRLRIGESIDGMFEFNKDNTDSVALQVKESLGEAEEWGRLFRIGGSMTILRNKQVKLRRILWKGSIQKES